jgi:hypothetical protein
LIKCDRFKPGPKRPTRIVELKPGHLNDQNGKHILDKIDRVLFRKSRALRPTQQKWRIQDNKSLPCAMILTATEAQKERV